MDLRTALQISEDAFPDGPETIAKEIGAIVRHTPLKGAEGWCVRFGESIIIRINSTSLFERQRFTLAHELAHVLTDSPTDVRSESDHRDPKNSHASEERVVDQVAAELLVPRTKLMAMTQDKLPVTASVLTEVARQSRVSEAVIARRIVSLKKALGIQHAFAADVDQNNVIRWMHPENECTEARLFQILDAIRSSGATELRYSRGPLNFIAIIHTSDWSTMLLVHSY